jgi:hypothetical protein
MISASRVLTAYLTIYFRYIRQNVPRHFTYACYTARFTMIVDEAAVLYFRLDAWSNAYCTPRRRCL